MISLHPQINPKSINTDHSTKDISKSSNQSSPNTSQTLKKIASQIPQKINTNTSYIHITQIHFISNHKFLKKNQMHPRSVLAASPPAEAQPPPAAPAASRPATSALAAAACRAASPPAAASPHGRPPLAALHAALPLAAAPPRGLAAGRRPSARRLLDLLPENRERRRS